MNKTRDIPLKNQTMTITHLKFSSNIINQYGFQYGYHDYPLTPIHIKNSQFCENVENNNQIFTHYIQIENNNYFYENHTITETRNSMENNKKQDKFFQNIKASKNFINNIKKKWENHKSYSTS